MNRALPDLEKIVSGGQTGVDRAALDVAIALGFACGGWVPRHRRAEDGRIAARYPVREAPGPAYEERTRLNVRDSDATLVLTRGRPTGGTALTVAVARSRGRPYLIVDLDGEAEPDAVRRWLVDHRVRVLNVAGPRESSSAGIHEAAVDFLNAVLAG
jgi:hypothetical protein